MKISIINCKDENFEPYVVRALECFGGVLFEDDELNNSIEITVIFFDQLEDMGEAVIDDFVKRGSPKKFSISLDYTMGVDRIFETLAHEMVHVKQFALEELNGSLSEWKGVKKDPDEIEYYFRPWEIEAMGFEIGLVRKFVTEEKLWKVFKGISNPNSYKLKRKDILWRKGYPKI
jgi:hypothetical protein